MEERRKRFYASFTLGNALTILAMAGAAIGIYTHVISDVNAQRIEINNLKINETKRESTAKDDRKEIKEEIKDVKTDVKEINKKLDLVIQDIYRRERRDAR